MNQTLFTEDALLPTGWARNVLLEWNSTGQLTQVLPDSSPQNSLPKAAGPLIPGMPNLHSHAFQRALAGLTECRSDRADSFWSWRDLMYRFAERITPAQLEAVATWLYCEMLEAGYTSVCEFHYVHHDLGGQPYADDATLALCLLRAAQTAGIGLTLLPVLYQSGGFGARPAAHGQRRFIRRSDDMLRLLARLKPQCEAQGARLGLAPHSLRAVPPEALREALAGLQVLDASAPVHIHIAEQSAEVEACMAWSGQRPLQWLLNHAAVDEHWCLVHATHLDAQEIARAAAAGAVVGLCPSTEANLGDGIFDMPAWQGVKGRWGLGSDSHATVNVAEELMLLEYSQRLKTGQRNVLATTPQRHTATSMTLAAVSGGAQASGRPVAGLAVGQQADFVALDDRHLALAGLDRSDMLSAHVFASHRTSAVRAVWVAGHQCVSEGRHGLHDPAAQAFVAARRQLMNQVTD